MLRLTPVYVSALDIRGPDGEALALAPWICGESTPPVFRLYHDPQATRLSRAVATWAGFPLPPAGAGWRYDPTRAVYAFKHADGPELVELAYAVHLPGYREARVVAHARRLDAFTVTGARLERSAPPAWPRSSSSSRATAPAALPRSKAASPGCTCCARAASH